MATYYISTTGNDANSGSAAAPWRTLSKGVATAIAGDTVIVNDGTYTTGLLRLLNSGTVNNRITFQAANQWQAIISSTSGCDPAFSVRGSYITLKDFLIKTDPTNVNCATFTSTNCDIRAWNSVDPSPGSPSTGWVGFIADGLKCDSTSTRVLSIKINQDDAIIRNCTVRRGIETLNTNNVEFYDNTILGQGESDYSVLVKGGARNTKVYRNIIYNNVAAAFGIVLGGDSCSTCVYNTTTKEEAYNCVAYNNVIIDQQSASPVEALTFMAARDCAFFNNVIVRGQCVAMVSSANGIKTVNPTIKNNIFYGRAIYSWISSRGFNYSGTATIDYNNFYNYSTMPAQVHAITGDPLLVNLSANWSLSTGSPCIDTGIDLSFAAFSNGTVASITLDYNGVTRTAPWDLGIYNYAEAAPGSSTSTSTATLSITATFGFFMITP